MSLACLYPFNFDYKDARYPCNITPFIRNKALNLELE